MRLIAFLPNDKNDNFPLPVGLYGTFSFMISLSRAIKSSPSTSDADSPEPMPCSLISLSLRSVMILAFEPTNVLITISCDGSLTTKQMD